MLYMFLMRMCAEDRSHDRLHGHDVFFLTIASLFQSYTNVMNNALRLIVSKCAQDYVRNVTTMHD